MKRFSLKVCLFLILGTTMSLPSNANTVAVGVNALGMAVGVGNVHLDIALGDSWTIGAEYQFIDDDEDSGIVKVDEEGNGYGLRLRYFTNKTLEDSWVFTAMVGTVETDLDLTISSLTGGAASTSTTTADGNYYGVMAGYHWQWSLIYMHLGLGFINYAVDTETTSTSGSSTAAIESSIDGGAAILDFSLGVAF